MKVDSLVTRIQRSAERLTRAHHLLRYSRNRYEEAAGRHFMAREATRLLRHALRLRVLLLWEGLRQHRRRGL